MPVEVVEKKTEVKWVFLYFRLQLEYLQGILNGTVHEDNNHMRSKSKFFLQ